MTNIFFTSDNHYFHDNIIKYCDRPFSGSLDMNAEMMSRWNSRVGPDDIGIFVGDISAGLKGRTEELRQIIQNLNGKKILIRGNHDHQSIDWYVESGFLKVFDFFVASEVVICHFPLSSLARYGFDDKLFGQYRHIIHGHVHEKNVNFEGHFNVAADRHDFYPLLYTEVMPQEFHDSFRQNICNLVLNTP
jgi:calcineurin-like phosphoesterase family protein